MTSEGDKRLTTDDALAYLKEIRVTFHEEKEKYLCFLHIMKDFKEERIDTEGVIAAVKELFKGHNDLILRLNTFLPKGYEIQLPLEDEQKTKTIVLGCEDATNIKNKTGFECSHHVYKSFIDIMNMLGEGKKSITEAHQEIVTLFEGDEDVGRSKIIESIQELRGPMTRARTKKVKEILNQMGEALLVTNNPSLEGLKPNTATI